MKSGYGGMGNGEPTPGAAKLEREPGIGRANLEREPGSQTNIKPFLLPPHPSLPQETGACS